MRNISTAMVLAAGFGKRLRPITDTIPKPLVPVAGRTMLDRTLDTLVKSGVTNAVVNMHYLGDQIEAHCKMRHDIACTISDERDAILETGGGVVKALPFLGEAPFIVVNADTFWVDFGAPNLGRMIAAFDPAKTDILLLVCRKNDTTGHAGGSDFAMDDQGRLARADKNDTDGFIFAGAAIYNPVVFDGARVEAHSLNVYFDKAIAAGRLHGIALQDGHWITVGTPDGLAQAEAKLKALT